MIEVVLRVRLDPNAVLDVERFTDAADRPVLAVRHADVDRERVGELVLQHLEREAQDISRGGS